MLYIIGGKILTMAGEIWEKGYICIENGKIRELGPMKDGAPFPLPEGGAEVINALGLLVMPGLIEAHCHMGITEEKKGMEGDDCNETVDPVTPYLRAIDAINPMDAAFDDAVRAGITSAMIGPGSANVVGGTFAFVKTCGRCIDDLIVCAPAAMKIAFGENPKVNYSGQGKSPATRMAIAAMLREELFKARRYYDKKCAGMKREEEDFRYECWIPVFEKKIPLKAHVHRADDIQTAIRIAKEFGLDMTLDHCSEGHLIAEQVKKSGFPAIIGPDLSSRSKIEVQNMAFKTIGVLNQAGVKTAITTDHPVSQIQTLPICAGLAVKSGLDEMEALKAITIYPAQICRTDHRVGSLEAGKDADIAIFDDLPLKVSSKTMCTIIDGQIVYSDKSFSLPACEKNV
ncbi:MAG: amidohydrolase [Lachnospiraceae bacterium]|jgi:imidazolonepropionase-like amidohydrolase|nr:amidohydrolase [Lachnospiraceae bacterium]GFI15100.1 adenine deaminase [Lachnospiraceae bacterium]